MAAEVPPDVVEQILLLGLDLKDIIRCKSVCKSWCCLISSPAFVKAHLKHQNNNIIVGGGGHRRIENDEWSFVSNYMYVVGSCNGLVCVSRKDDQLVVTNPWTREIKKLQRPRYQPEELVWIRQVLILGFGYDASTDDYKVVAGFRKGIFDQRTDFYVLALKSNVWNFIGQVKYESFMKYHGIFCGGALYWFMMDTRKKVIMSIDLSTDICKEIPQPEDAEYKCGDLVDHNLGVIKECLCIYSSNSGKKWVMKNNNWELYNYDESKYDVLHCLIGCPVVGRQRNTRYVYSVDDGTIMPYIDGNRIISASMFVESLVSPHPPMVQREENNDAKGNIRKRSKRKKRSCKHKRVFF